MAAVLAVLLVLSVAFQWSTVRTPLTDDGPGMGTPIPASWDIGKSSSHSLGALIPRVDLGPPSLGGTPSADRLAVWLASGVEPLILDGRTLLLHLGRLLLEGG